VDAANARYVQRRWTADYRSDTQSHRYAIGVLSPNSRLKQLLFRSPPKPALPAGFFFVYCAERTQQSGGDMAKQPRTDWDNIPHQTPNARIVDYKDVKNARVIHLTKATIRNCEVSGTFLLAAGAEMKTYAGRQRIEVQCLWFGRKPYTTWMHITVLGGVRHQDNYFGKVVWDIGR
jgi:hypothetical protein